MKVSARILGHMVGLNAKEVNQRLASIGYLEGKPGSWFITEKGRRHGEERYKNNGYGGYAARSWSYYVWDEEVAYQIGDPDAYLKAVNHNRKLGGLSPIESWNEL